MPPKNQRTKPVAQFAVVQQSYEDPEAGDKPKPVLVPVSKRTHRPLKPTVRFVEDLDDEDDRVHRLNMRMADDTVEDRIFDDEVEEDFDNDWIKQMMTGDGVIDSEEEYDDLEEDEYPAHTEQRALERQFDRAMDDFDFDGNIDEEDPRAHGRLDVMDYAPALEEFVQEHAGASYFHPEDAMRHKGFMNKMRQLATQHRVFDSNAEGHFVVALDADKGRRVTNHFYNDKEALKELTLRSIRDGHIDTTDALYREDDKLVPLKVPKKEDKMDCETMLSTYTNVYNNPTVIAAQTKKVKLSVAGAKKAKQEAAAASKGTKHADPNAAHDKPAAGKSPANRPTKIGAAVPPMAAGAATSSGNAEHDDDGDDSDDMAPQAIPTEEELWADLPDEALPSIEELHNRPSDETKEEKKLRRALVKQLQRERRAEKKSTKTAYKQAGAVHAHAEQRQRLDKKTIPMSVVRRA